MMTMNRCEIILTPLAAWAVASLLLMAGCVTNKPGLVLDPVGPPPELPSAVATQGFLIVFSAYDVLGISGEDRQVHTDYEIFSEDGTLLRKVRNDPGTTIGGPTRVQLTAGSYRVVASANRYGIVTVPVVIAVGKVTVVHLEGGGSWPNRQEMIQANAVRLPDGRVVGWRANAPNPVVP